MDCGSCGIGYPSKDLRVKKKVFKVNGIPSSQNERVQLELGLVDNSIRYLADKKQQVSVAGEVHGEEEQGQFLHHRDAAFMGQCKG